MTKSITFALETKSGWPPVSSESLQFDVVEDGFECRSTPLFVANLSIHDVIRIDSEQEGQVMKWRHLFCSNHSTVWLLRLSGDPPILTCLERVRSLQCDTTRLDELGCYAIDVPPSTSIKDVDDILATLDPELVAVAFPSMRHRED